MIATEPLRYGRAVVTGLPFGEAVIRVKELLRAQGFGVLCEIDVSKTLREKSDVPFRPYTILGTCNPQLAYRALVEEAHLGLLLPCNVVVQEDEGRTIVAAVDAGAMLGVVENAALASIAEEANTRLGRVLDGMARWASTAEFDRWETRYGDEGYLFGTEPNAFLASQKACLPKSGRALAVADGEGRNGVWLAQQGLDVLSLDFSPKAQEKARALARSRGIAIATELANVLTWTWPTSEYDVIAVIFTQFAAPPERARMFAGIRQALKPGGLLVLEGYTPKQLQYGTGGPSNVENMYTRELLEQEFAGFAQLEFKEYETEISEGTRHAGRSALIDLVARK